MPTAVNTQQTAPATPDQTYEILSQVLEQSVDAALLIDQDSRIVLFNQAAESLWGKPRQSVLGQSLETVLPCPMPHAQEAAGALEHSGCPDRMAGNRRNLAIRRAGGDTCMVSVSVSRIGTSGDSYFTVFVRDITHQQAQQQRMRELSLVVDKSDNAIFVSAPDRSVVYVNRGFSRMFGYGLEDMQGRTPAQVLSGPHTEPNLNERVDAALAACESLQAEVLLYAKSGRPLWVSAAINPVQDEHGHLVGLVSVLTDITHTKMHQVMHQKVLNAVVRDASMADVMTLICREVEHIAPEVVASIVAVEPDGRLRPLAAPGLPPAMREQIANTCIGPNAGSSGATAWRGKPLLVADIATDPVCADYRHLLLPHGLQASWTNPIKSSNGRVLGTMTFYYREPRGPDELHARLIDTCLHLCALAMEREHANERVHQLAFYDTLTGLPNRIMFSAKAEQALANAGQMNAPAAVLFIDLDRFKLINDAQGHAAGDGLLRDIALRLGEEMAGINIIGRQAGDEFVAVLPHCSAEQAGSMAERLLSAIALPTTVGLMTLHPSASIGVAMYPDDGRDIELLVRHADMAMYRAKGEGGGSFRFFSGDMNKVAQERVSLETALRDALRLQQLQLEYQPQVRGGQGTRIYGVEALLRWQHPELGAIPPARFIPVAEESGLISELSIWVLRQACAQMAHWRKRGVNVPRVSVNISAINFRDPDLSALIARTLDAHGLVPDDLTLEITESVMLDPDPDVLDNIEAIYAMGVRLSLDDFGTGYSSLSHLHRLPIYELKLDQSFVRDIDTSAIARTLTTSVLRIGESLGMKVVAEGVETASQHRFLAEQGCPVLQGFLFSESLSAPALEQWLLQNEFACASDGPEAQPSAEPARSGRTGKRRGAGAAATAPAELD
ncbi:EAL domain-containing protein [Pseudoxanthomonas wuyuanensis]|uniref:EAL domain-containing protein n=1 Tax=Pseudoxanthomonas wuyuanensis TaxID=1073196 RepID=UPI001FD35B1A|nr:EAL domain-containing protein [Pseudoxanthomonas wuyuanensis]